VSKHVVFESAYVIPCSGIGARQFFAFSMLIKAKSRFAITHRVTRCIYWAISDNFLLC